MGGLAGAFVGGGTSALQGEDVANGMMNGLYIGMFVGGLVGGVYGYFGSGASAYAAGENWALNIWQDPLGYVLKNPGSTVIPAVGLIGTLLCKKKSTENDFSKNFSCSF